MNITTEAIVGGFITAIFIVLLFYFFMPIPLEKFQQDCIKDGGIYWEVQKMMLNIL